MTLYDPPTFKYSERPSDKPRLPPLPEPEYDPPLGIH